MNRQLSKPVGPVRSSLLRVLRVFTRPRYRAQVSQPPKLTPIADVLARAGREPQQPV